MIISSNNMNNIDLRAFPLAGAESRNPIPNCLPQLTGLNCFLRKLLSIQPSSGGPSC